jgi:hypothetical protein
MFNHIFGQPPLNGIVYSGDFWIVLYVIIVLVEDIAFIGDHCQLVELLVPTIRTRVTNDRCTYTIGEMVESLQPVM